MTSISERLAAHGLVLPTPAAPVATYRPVVRTGALLFVSGQLPFGADGELIRGRLGRDLTVGEGAQAAQACALMLLAQVAAAVGDEVGRIVQVVKLGVFVASDADFHDQPKVANGASDLMVAVFGERGLHARSAVGVPCLPLGAAVEVDATVEIRTT